MIRKFERKADGSFAEVEATPNANEVIFGLTCCLGDTCGQNTMDKCPYHTLNTGHVSCERILKEDALKLIMAMVRERESEYGKS